MPSSTSNSLFSNICLYPFPADDVFILYPTAPPSYFYFIYLFIHSFIHFRLFRAVPTAYGSSRARDQNQSCSCQPTQQPQQCSICDLYHSSQVWILNPLSKARGRTLGLMDSWMLVGFVNHWAMMGTPPCSSYFYYGYSISRFIIITIYCSVHSWLAEYCHCYHFLSWIV